MVVKTQKGIQQEYGCFNFGFMCKGGTTVMLNQVPQKNTQLI